MARKPLRPCRHPGCAVLVRDGYCEQHQPDRRSSDSLRYRSWYSRKVWTDDLRPNQLLREPFCQDPNCPTKRLTGRPAPATDVDHVIPHDGDWVRFVDPDNLRSLCHACHSRKTAGETRAKMRASRS